VGYADQDAASGLPVAQRQHVGAGQHACHGPAPGIGPSSQGAVAPLVAGAVERGLQAPEFLVGQVWQERQGVLGFGRRLWQQPLGQHFDFSRGSVQTAVTRARAGHGHWL
jgi:hypothetical protein